jgi:hypothetical protein
MFASASLLLSRSTSGMQDPLQPHVTIVRQIVHYVISIDAFGENFAPLGADRTDCIKPF